MDSSCDCVLPNNPTNHTTPPQNPKNPPGRQPTAQLCQCAQCLQWDVLSGTRERACLIAANDEALKDRLLPDLREQMIEFADPVTGFAGFRLGDVLNPAQCHAILAHYHDKLSSDREEVVVCLQYLS